MSLRHSLKMFLNLNVIVGLILILNNNLAGFACFESTRNNMLIAAKYTWVQIFWGGMSVTKKVGNFEQ